MSAATMTHSDIPAAFIKNEPDDLQFDPNSFMKHSNNMNTFNQQQQPHNQYGSWQGMNGGHVDPLALNMNPAASMHQHQHQHPNQQQSNMSSSMFMGNGGSAVTDDDLLDSFAGSGNQHMNGNHDHNGNMGSFHHPNGFQNSMPQNMAHQQQSFNYSNTPDGQPIRSPFNNGFDYANWHTPQNSMPPPVARSLSGQGINTHDRSGSISRSPMTQTNMGSPEAGSAMQGRAIAGTPIHNHRHSSSTHWESSLGSGPSHFDSPLSSPGAGPVHPQISEVLKSGPPASPSSAPSSHAKSSADAKKAKRRASHNEVERRRRNHINDQISALSRLVPQHRLDDDIIRRAMHNNSTLPPSVTGISPPQATSLLAGGNGRRATAGNITQGLPTEDRDKNPAKGDVLNGAVSWTSDLLWMMDRMLKREQFYQEMMPNLEAPIPVTEEEHRMRSELASAIERNIGISTSYSRRDGTGLHVPGFTRHDGGRLENGEQTSPGLSMQHKFNGNGMSQEIFFNDFTTLQDEIKEEEDLNMELTE